MAQSARLSDGVIARGAAALVPPTHDRRDAQPRNLDWDLARLTKANLLLVGPEQTVTNLVFAIWSILDGPIVIRRRNERLLLPPAADYVGTLVLHGIETLTFLEQANLCEWLGARHGRARVVSTTPTSMLAMIGANRFRAELYYRLNTIWMDVSGR